jgi:predicted DCC family thiol-disulfide oxidoreductase YuxK
MTVPVVRFTVSGEDRVRPSLGRPYTVVYDGDCRVCTRLAHVLDGWDRDRRLEIVSSQTPGVPARFPWIPPGAYADALQLIAADGTTWQGAAAIEQLLNILPKGAAVSWLFKIPFVRGIADRFYKWFARNRYKLGCGDHCQSRPPQLMWDEAERP